MQELSPGQEFLLMLERERYNVAHRVSAEPKIQVREVIRWQTKPCTKQHVSKKHLEERDRIMFNAGRYAAGARDATATAANDRLQEELGE